jgi:SEC-C motif
MSAHAHLVPTYLRLRKIGMNLSHRLVETLGKDVMHEGGQKLGILQKGKLVLGSEDELAVLMDFCIYDVYRGGRNAVQRMLADSPPSDPEELALLKAQARAYYSIFQAVDVEPGAGVTVKDMLRKDTIFVTDVGFSRTARIGFGLASRLIPLDGYFMTGGASLPMDKRVVHRIDDDLQRWIDSGKDFAHLTAAENAELTAEIIRGCLEVGMGEHIVYATPGEASRAGRESPVRVPFPRVRANRNDPCPCGSGRKYKSCCGKR